MPKVWRIQGLDSTNLEFELDVPFDSWVDDQVKEVLRRLASRHLVADEVVASSLPRSATGGRSDLEILPVGGKKHGFMTNGNPYYVAIVEDV